MKISYLNNHFNNDFSNFNIFLTNFTSFGDCKFSSRAPFSDAVSFALSSGGHPFDIQ